MSGNINVGTVCLLESKVIFDSFGFELLLFVICSKLSQPMKKVLFVRYRISLNNRQGQLLLFLHLKGGDY